MDPKNFIIEFLINSPEKAVPHNAYGEDSPFGYVNSEMIRLLNVAKDTIDLDKLDRIYQEIMPIFAEDMPITLVLPSVFTSVVHRRIKGLSSPFWARPVVYMEHLWIEEEKK